MSYIPTEWKTGDVITEGKLNHIEEGIGDGGLPKNTFNSIKPGTAMVFDGNEWIQQEGYAYIEKTQEDIVWEGDTNGRDSFDLQGLTLYKISDLVPEPSDLIGCVFTINDQTGTITSDMINSDTPGVTVISDGGVMVFSETSISSEGMTIEVPSTGIYSLRSCSISFPKTVHKFDSELIESSGQNNVEFVKIFSNISVSVDSQAPVTPSGGVFTDQKSLGELIGEKTIIGFTSVFHYDPNGGTSGTPDKYTSTTYPVDTQLGFPLWEQKNHLTDTSSGLKVYWGYLFHPSDEGFYYGVLDIYAICI